MGIDSFSEIERRIKRIEAALGIVDENDAPAPSLAKTPPPPTVRASTLAAPTSGLFLGAIAGLCLILAAVLMIRLAIESGWLTPLRQVWISALFGSACVATGFFAFARDRAYVSILPGLGIAILNLAVYGATFVHHLIDPGTAAVAVSAISLLCLALYAALAEDLYVLYAALGTHLGAAMLGGSAPSPEMPLAVLLVWNFIFAQLAVRSGSRRLLSVIAYCGFATVYLVGHGERVLPAALTQALLFFIYLSATVQFSKRHERPLTRGEALSLFPPLLVFYITEYAWLSKLLGPLTPYLFLGLAAVVWGAYASAAAKIRSPLASGTLVHAFIAGTVLHAFFFQIVPDEAKPIVGLLLGGAILLRRDRLDFAGEHLPLQFLAVFVFMGGFLMALFESAHDPRFAILNGVAYGLGLLYHSVTESARKQDTQLRDFAAVLAHLQWMTALYRAREFFAVESLSLVVTVLWVAYAFAVFGIGWARRFAWLCRSCLFILTFCVLKLMVYDVWNQAPVIRIVSLAGLGVALYAFGFLLRRVAAWTQA